MAQYEPMSEANAPTRSPKLGIIKTRQLTANTTIHSPSSRSGESILWVGQNKPELRCHGTGHSLLLGMGAMKLLLGAAVAAVAGAANESVRPTCALGPACDASWNNPTPLLRQFQGEAGGG